MSNIDVVQYTLAKPHPDIEPGQPVSFYDMKSDRMVLAVTTRVLEDSIEVLEVGTVKSHYAKTFLKGKNDV